MEKISFEVTEGEICWVTLYLCNVDNLEVPSNHEGDGSEDTNSDVYHGVDCRLLEAGAAPSLALSVLGWSSPVVTDVGAAQVILDY